MKVLNTRYVITNNTKDEYYCQGKYFVKDILRAEKFSSEEDAKYYLDVVLNDFQKARTYLVTKIEIMIWI